MGLHQRTDASDPIEPSKRISTPDAIRMLPVI
jgi:hypothetical protein